ncbi:MAG: asparagine synthase (glutamine-hydrolyzing) [Rickettsiales bacterium]|nr:asparagine synthase (glutamine-hydrolyzing) [Rickettsiales bacterium]OUV81514.1 MAG: asparagine synthase (glutamine-hydrolyzing) [Rickettsiales bacterium TMED131]
MCGFIGVVSLNNIDRSISLDRKFDRAYQRLKARGPDAKGTWIDKNSYFLHTRLKILDLSKESAQPMKKDNYIICFNGEIYNFKDIKEELIKKGHSFISNGDTEVLITAWIEWGDAMLEKLDGMFSFVIWDVKNKNLFLARDRFGKKPLAYCIKNNSIYFSSDIKSLNYIISGGEVNKEAIHSLLRFRFIHEPMTIYENFKKLPSGTFMTFNQYGSTIRNWFTFKLSKKNNKNLNLKTLINNSVKKRLLSDVPIGLFLSGGIDSAIIMDSVAEQGKKIPTYTIGFKNESSYYDESNNAKKISRYYGFENETIYLEQNKIINSIDNILDANDEPFADSSAIAMYLISNSVKNNIKVALSGDGGDELFGGYRKYISYKWRKAMYLLPKSIKKILVDNLSDNKDTYILNFMRKIKRFIENFDDDLNIMQTNFLEQLSKDEFKKIFALEKKPLPEDLFNDCPSFEGLNKVLARDFKFSLLGDMLVKLDRQSMANSLEVRSPFLDKDLVEYSFSIPSTKKIGFFNGKKILRSCYENYLPKWYFKLPKKGFEVPLQNWLRKDLRYMIEEATRNVVLESLHIKDKNTILRWKRELLNGNKDNSWKLWTLISYYHWAKSSNVI